MKILFLLTQDLESPLGIGRIWPLAKELAKAGHQVRIAALHSRWDELTKRRFEQEGVVVQYVGPMHVRKVGSQKMYYSMLGLIGVTLRATLALTRAALGEKVDIIHIGKPHPMNGIAGLLAKWLQGGILCVDCDDYEAASNRFGAGWQRKVVAFFEQHIPCQAQVVTTHTQFMWDKLVAWGCPAERIHYLSNGVDRQRFSLPELGAVTALRKKLELQEKRIVAFLGTLSLANHPVNLLIEAFKLVIMKIPEAALLLVGGGDDYDRLEALASQSGIRQAVYFAGRVSPAELPVYYALAEVSVDPVYDDDAGRGRLPIKVFESWVMGVPFVTANVGDRERLLGQPPAGVIAQRAGDPHALAEAILQIMESPERAAQIRQRGLERVRSYYWDELAEQMEAIYQEALVSRDERKHRA